MDINNSAGGQHILATRCGHLLLRCGPERHRHRTPHGERPAFFTVFFSFSLCSLLAACCPRQPWVPARALDRAQLRAHCSLYLALSLPLSLSFCFCFSLPLSLSTLPARAESVVHSTARRLQATNEHPQDSAKARRITLLRVLLRAPVTLIANHNPGQSNLVAKLKRWPLFDLEEMLATLWHVGTWGHSMIHQQIAMMCGPDGQRLSADHQQALSVRVCVHAFLPLLSQAFDSPTASTVAPPAECCERCL